MEHGQCYQNLIYILQLATILFRILSTYNNKWERAILRAIRIPINRLDKKFLESRFAINIVEVNAFPNRSCFEIYDDS